MEKKLEKLLVVDDEADLRELLGFMVENICDCEILEASSGLEAISLLKAHPIDLVFCDYNMPDGNGTKVYEFIRENNLSTQYVLMSNEPEFYLSEFGDDVGVLQKPFNQNKVYEHIEKFLEDRNFKQSIKFFRIPINVLEKIETTNFELFIHSLEKNEYTMIKERGLSLDPQRFKKHLKYIEGNDTHLYINISDVSEFVVEYRKYSLRKNGPSENVQKNIKDLAETFAIAKDLNTVFGWSEDIVKVTEENIALVLEEAHSVSALRPYLEKLDFSDQTCFASHSALIAYISVGLCSQLAKTYSINCYKLAVAALLHDITLSENQITNKEDFLLAIKNKSFVELVDLKAIKEHPMVASNLAENWPGQEGSEIKEIILHHHELPDGSGFPLGKKAEELSPLQSIFIAAEAVTHTYIHNQNIDEFKSSIETLSKTFTGGHFNQIFTLLVSI